MEPLISLTIFGIALIYTEVAKNKKRLQAPIALVGLLVTLGLTAMSWGHPTTYFNQLCVVHDFATAFNLAMLGSMVLILGVGCYYYNDVEEHVGEIYGLMLFAIFGGYLITGYSSLIMLYLGIETLSIPLYVLAGSRKLSYRSNEASFKYFVMGGFASALLLLGVALVYGAAGSFSLEAINAYLLTSASIPSILPMGVVLILIGFLFKVAAMPFHFWAPDVYDGSPTLVTAFMATVVKMAVFAAFYLLFDRALIMMAGLWQPIIWGAALLTLVGSNVIALNQSSVKRLLAYASISSSGFLLLPILAGNGLSASALLYYLVTYALAAIPAFAVLTAIRKTSNGDDSLDAFNGLVRRSPLVAFTFAVALLSLAGIPITGGFFGKYFIFLTAINSGFVWITVAAVAAALLGLYYFFRVLNRVFLREGDAAPIVVSGSMKLVLVASAILTIVLGLAPGLIVGLI
jgi:NADH-quinone oxidoreductase subunit N